MTYKAKVLKDGATGVLESFDERDDVVTKVPKSFGTVAVFIDGLHKKICPNDVPKSECTPTIPQ